MTGGGTLTYVGGNKGGVGKSLVTMCVIDYMRVRGEKVILVEADRTNSDVYLAYHPLLGSDEAVTLELSREDGWFALGDIVRANARAHLVVNTPAGLIETGKSYAHHLTDIGQLAGQLRVLWPINRQRDCVQLLRRFINGVEPSTIGVIRNLFFGEAEGFTRLAAYMSDSPDKRIRIGDLADLHDQFIDLIYDERTPLEQLQERVDLIRGGSVSRWRSGVHQMLEALLI